MFNYAPFLLRRLRFAWIVLLCMISLIMSAEAQHGGSGHGGGGHSAGGHSSGGHFGGGHSSPNRSTSGHSGGHFGWLRFNFKNRDAHRTAPTNVSGALLPRPAEPTWRMPARALPSTLIRIIPVESTTFTTRKERSSSSWLRHRPRRSFGHFPCPHSSGCYFDGFNQVCFFEPLLPIFSSGFYLGLLDYGFEVDAMDQSGELMPTDTAFTAAAADTESENLPSTSPPSASPPSDFRGEGLDPRFFLLILKNGTEQVVTDYWVADGYIEYVSRDGSRSHFPIEALNLQQTVTENSYRGLAFSLRSTPPQN